MKTDKQAETPYMPDSSRWSRSTILARDSVRASGGDVDDEAMDIIDGAGNGGDYSHDDAAKMIIERHKKRYRKFG